MALSDKEISALYFEALGSQHLREQDRKMVTRFARAIEAEVRKRDEALIRQMLKALNTCDESYGFNGPYQFHDDEAVEAAITAARARLGEQT